MLAVAGAGGCGGGAHISLRLRDLRLGFYASWPLTLRRTLLNSSSSSSFACSESPRSVPVLSSCFSHQEDDHVVHSEDLSSLTGGVVALGKFDALHIGHRELAIQASKAGHPFLLSFVGMAEVLGWEPRSPIVAKCDRKRVLSSWAPYCDDMVPKEVEIEFSSVRRLSAQEFVEKLSKELRVRGVVAGENYRFGYKAAGDAAELVRLCEEYGLGAYIINSVMDTCQFSTKIPSSNAKDTGQVSSTRVRRALAVGDMKYVSELLGRPHRLILKETNAELFSFQKNKITASKLCLLNLAPREGLYENCSLLVGELGLRCRVVIDTAKIHIEMGDEASYTSFGSENPKLVCIEFGSTYS